jgi:predicted nucleic acid-binding protein
VVVVSDTSPLCYFLLIDSVRVLPQIYGQIAIPQAVRNELADERSPAIVRRWIGQPPDWLEIQTIRSQPDSSLQSLDLGEKEAIVLAEQLDADLIVLDDLLARQIARSRNLRIIGLLGILEVAANRGLIDLPSAIARLQQTTFRASSRLLQSLLDRYSTDP